VGGVVVDMNNAEEAGEADVALRCSIIVRTLTTTTDRIVVATHRISRSRIRHISHVRISLNKDMVATIREVDLHQIMGDQHTTILLLAVPPLVEGEYLQARNITHMALAVEVMDRITEDLVEIMAATVATVATVVARGVELCQLDEAGMAVTADRLPMVMVAMVAATARTTLGVGVGAGIDVDSCQSVDFTYGFCYEYVPR